MDQQKLAAQPLMLLGSIAIGLGYLLPGHYPPWNSFEQQALSAFGCSLVVAALAMSATRFALPVIAVQALAMAAVPLLQWGFGQVVFLSDAALSAAYLVAFALCVGAAAAPTSDRPFADALGAALIAAAIASTGLALIQWLQVGAGWIAVDAPPGGRPYANLAQPNHLSTLLALGVVAILRLYEHRRMSGGVAALAVVWLGLGLLLTQSRTGWLFVAMLLAWWAVMRQRAALRLSLPAIGIGVVTFVLLVASWDRVNDALLLASGSVEERLHAGTRWLHWQTLWDAALRKPWTGYGWSQVVFAQQVAALDHPASHEWLQNSHNLVLDLLLWNGIPLGLVWVGGIVAWFALQIRACRSPEQWTWLAAVGAVFLHSLLEYPLDYTYFLLPVGLMMGRLERLRGTSAALSVPRWAGVSAILAMLAVLGWVSSEYLRVQDAARHLRFAMVGVDASNPAARTAPDVRLLDAPREFHRFLVTTARPSMTDGELDWMRTVSQRHAVPAAMLRYALAAGLNGREAEAADTLARLCKMHPKPRCDEAQQSWQLLQQQYPVLLRIHVPDPN